MWSTVSQTYFRPATTSELLERLREFPGSAILAGGTDLIPSWKKRVTPFGTVLDASAAAREWCGIHVDGGGIEIGAFATFRAILDFPVIQREYPALAMACRMIGSRQIRNVATVGGNVANASPAGDSIPPLLVYGASVRCVSVAGSRLVPLDEFFLSYKRTALLPDELIASVRMPHHPPLGFCYYRKAGPRRSLAISRAALAGGVGFSGDGAPVVRLAAAGVAPYPARLLRTEKVWAALLSGWAGAAGEPPRAETPAPFPREAGEELARDISPIDDIRGSASYKFDVTLNMLREMWESLPPAPAPS